MLAPALRAQITVLASFYRNSYLTHPRPPQQEASPSTMQFAMMIAVKRGQGRRLCVYGFRQDSGFACNSFENIANRFGGVGNLVANGISSTCHLVANGIGGTGNLVTNGTGGTGNRVTNGIGGAGDLVTQITSGVNHLGLNLLGIPLGFEKGVIGELTGGRLQLAFDVLGGGVDLVVDAHGDAAEGGRERS